ncbi:hypothetical protein PGT21_008208 [Puccinia graminis f. sp. tritici]|uniref:Uncharacterized protein n=1 Tax=Puccinia graminis f. sp. tritici TaxID=56615 RepID=A0A5B0MAI4_PUCGR|nr:hypothetical protein PGT21_008208 [Puccinia graminis f. sp. tritici]
MKLFSWFSSSFFLTSAMGMKIPNGGSSVNAIEKGFEAKAGTEINFGRDASHAPLVKRHHQDCGTGYAVVGVPVYQPVVCTSCGEDHHHHHHDHC